MNDLITIGNTQFTAKTLDGNPVLTFRDIDAIHHRPEGSARKRFNDNRQRFAEGEDYFKVTCGGCVRFSDRPLQTVLTPTLK